MYIVVVTFHLDFSCNCYENCLLIFIQRSKFIKMVDVRFFVALHKILFESMYARMCVRVYMCVFEQETEKLKFAFLVPIFT